MSKAGNTTTADDTANLGLGQSILVGATGKFILAVFGFVGVVFFYRDLGPTKIGSYYTILAAVKIATQFQNSITSAIQKRVSEVGADQSGYLGIGIASWVGITVIVGIMILASMPLANQFSVSVAHLVGGLAMMSTLGLFATANQFYMGIGNPGKGNWTDAVRSVLTLAGQVALLLIGFGEFGLIWGFVFGNIVTAVGLFVMIGVIPTRPSRRIISRTADFAKWSLPNGLASVIYSRLDVLVLGWVLGSTAVGYYQPAFQLTVPATFVASSISQSLAVKSSGLDSQGSSVIGDLRNGIAYAGLVSVPLFFGALALPKELMGTIFGPSAVAGAGALVGIALLQIFRSYMQPMGSVIQAVDRPDLVFNITVVVLLVNVPLAVVLVNWYGLMGVVAATVFAGFLRLTLTTVLVTRLFSYPGVPRETLEQLLAAIVMFGIIESMTQGSLIQINSVVTLLAVVGSGAAIYFCTLITVSRKFRNTAMIIIEEIFSS